MFNFFKNKQKLVPEDIKNGMMASIVCEIKPNTKLDLESNIVCFVSYKDKIYLSLTEGYHTLDEKNLSGLIAKQTKFNKDKQIKPKQIKMDLFFVNKTSFDLTNSFTIKYPIAKQKTKIRFEYSIKMNVEDETKFCKAILGELALPTSKTTNKVVFSYIDEIIYFYFLKKDLNSIYLSFEIKDALKKKIAKMLAKIGVNLIDFNLSLYPTDSKLNKTSIFNQPADNPNISTQNEVDSTDLKFDSLQNEQKPNTTQENLLDNSSENKDNIDNTICPNCKNKIIKNSAFCHRCGYKF